MTNIWFSVRFLPVLTNVTTDRLFASVPDGFTSRLCPCGRIPYRITLYRQRRPSLFGNAPLHPQSPSHREVPRIKPFNVFGGPSSGRRVPSTLHHVQCESRRAESGRKKDPQFGSFTRPSYRRSSHVVRQAVSHDRILVHRGRT